MLLWDFLFLYIGNDSVTEPQSLHKMLETGIILMISILNVFLVDWVFEVDICDAMGVIIRSRIILAILKGAS